MGCVSNITHDSFPKQGEMLGKRTKVCFHYNADVMLMGTVIRDDVEEPYRTIIQLDDGRAVAAEECQYQPR